LLGRKRIKKKKKKIEKGWDWNKTNKKKKKKLQKGGLGQVFFCLSLKLGNTTLTRLA
jgi:hypothetical protein